MSTRRSASEKSRIWPVILAIVLVALLGYTVMRLFSLRFARGDIYPPYSSLRTDPLGTKVLADAISELPGFSVQRSFRQLSRLKLAQSAAIVYVGIDYRMRIDEKEFEEAQRLVTSGARLILTFAPELSQKSAPSTAPKPGATPAPTATPAPASASPPAATPAPAIPPSPGATPKPARRGSKGFMTDDRRRLHQAASEEWGVSFDRSEGDARDVTHTDAVPGEDNTSLDATVPWHTALFFKDFNPKVWRTLYWSDGEAVVIERSLGAGSIVLCSDSYFLSNEGLLNARAPKLIARVIGPAQLVIFDEFHNGVSEQSNIAGLARKYGLGGAILALLGVAALFIWKNAVPFLPPQRPSDLGDSHVIGLDANAGFTNLLRRGVPPGRALTACIAEWRKSRGSRVRAEELAHVESVMRGHEGKSAFKDAPAAYRIIASGLNHR